MSFQSFFQKNNILVYNNNDFNFSIWIPHTNDRLWILENNNYILSFRLDLKNFSKWLKKSLLSKESKKLTQKCTAVCITDDVKLNYEIEILLSKENGCFRNLIFNDNNAFYAKQMPIRSLNAIADSLLTLV